MLLQRHYLQDFMKLFLVIGAGLGFLITMLDFVKYSDSLFSAGAHAADAAELMALNFPRYFLYLMPMAVLVSSLYTVGQASRSRELIAVMASGGRVKRVLLPFALTGALMSLLAFLIGELVVPELLLKAEALEARIHGAKEGSITRDGITWARATDGSIVRMDFYFPGEDVFRGITVYTPENHRIGHVIKSGEAAYTNAAWRLTDVADYDISTGSVRTRKELDYPFLGAPTLFGQRDRKPQELSIFELSRHLKRLREAGFSNPRLNVEMHSKLSYPAVNFIMIVIGASFASRRHIGGLISAATGLGITMLYWMTHMMSMSLGYAGLVPPVVAAWFAPLIFLALSAYLFAQTPE